MGEYVRRLREPALIGLLVVTGLLQLVALANFAILVFGQGMGYPPAARAAGSGSASLVWIFGVLALALACLLLPPPSPNARKLVTAAAVVVSLVAGISVAFWLLGLLGSWTLGSGLAAVGWLIETVVRVLVAIVLWRLRKVAAEERAHVEQATTPSGDLPGTQPVWSPDQAVGLQWSRAGDAATGAAAPAQPAALAGGATEQPALAPARAASGEPEAEPVVDQPPPRRTTWSRGGVAPEAQASGPHLSGPQPLTEPSAQPWTTAAQAAGGQPAGLPEIPAPPAEQRRPAPDWSPAPRTEQP